MTIPIHSQEDWGPLATFVPNKRLPVYNWLYYKEGFARDLVWRFLDQHPVDGQVLDPFCGSGTTLLASQERNLESIGLDALPIALLASQVKTTLWNPEELKKEAQQLTATPFRSLDTPFPYKRFFNRHTLQDILLFHDALQSLEHRPFFQLALITAAMRASWAWKDGTILKVKKHPVPPFRKFFKRHLNRMIKDLGKVKRTAPARIEHSDHLFDIKSNSIAGVFTSPPYLNQIDYSRVYAIEDWFLGKATLSAYLGKESEEDYFADMTTLLKQLARICLPDAPVGLVVGNAYFPQEDRIVDVDTILAEQAHDLGFEAKEILVLNTRHALQRRTIKRGVLRESLLIVEKE